MPLQVEQILLSKLFLGGKKSRRISSQKEEDNVTLAHLWEGLTTGFF